VKCASERQCTKNKKGGCKGGGEDLQKKAGGEKPCADGDDGCGSSGNTTGIRKRGKRNNTGCSEEECAERGGCQDVCVPKRVASGKRATR